MAEITSFDEFLNAASLKVEPVDVSEWMDAQFFVKEMDAEAFGKFIQLQQETKGDDGNSSFTIEHMSLISAMTMCNSDGELIVSRDDWQESAKMLPRSLKYEALVAISGAALKVSGFTEESGKE